MSATFTQLRQLRQESPTEPAAVFVARVFKEIPHEELQAALEAAVHQLDAARARRFVSSHVTNTTDDDLPKINLAEKQEAADIILALGGGKRVTLAEMTVEEARIRLALLEDNVLRATVSLRRWRHIVDMCDAAGADDDQLLLDVLTPTVVKSIMDGHIMEEAAA